MKRLQHIENLITSDLTDPTLVRGELKHVYDLQRQFLFIFEKAQNVFLNENIFREFVHWMEKLHQEIFFVKSSSINWLKKVEVYSDFKSNSSKSRSSKSQKESSHSSGSSR